LAYIQGNQQACFIASPFPKEMEVLILLNIINLFFAVEVIFYLPKPSEAHQPFSKYVCSL